MTEKHHTGAATQMDTIAKNPPRLEFPANLPITERVDEISRAISEHQVIIICGETGSGKTTQIPKICLQLGLGRKAMIGHTQPRRIAARTIAGRIAEELNVQLGREVGYQVRHHDQTSDATCIKLMTDGVLLAEMQQHSSLKQYQVLIIDEAHERSLNIDFILGYLKRLLPRRPDLKVIITSATIDVERLSEHFDRAPIISVSGRSYPVSIRYSPVEEFTSDRAEQNEQALLTAIEALSAENSGDILVFVHGEGEVHGLSRFLDKQKLPNTDVLPLYSRLNRAAQSHIFKPHSKRHIILATNVAETSLTIPGITHVIDFGDARISRYSHKSKIQRLPIEKISQAAARQRAGRCGRTQEGICIRLYSEEDFLQRAEYTEPEILRTNLATVILQMKAMGLGDIEDFPFLDKPHSKLISDGIRLLTELSALDDHQQLNQTGKQMARMPLDPRLARMLIAANHYHSVAEICVICGFLSIQDPRERPQDATEKADKAHSRFQNSNSDFIGIMNLWNFIEQQKEKLSRSKFKKLCKQNFLSYSRITEWHELYSQLTELCRSLKFTVNEQKAEYNNIHCALLYGLLSHIAKKEIDGRSYQGARGNTLYIFPGSSVFESTPAWIMAAELSETSKLYARHVAKIDPKWLLKPAKKLAKYEYNEPRWDQKKQSIVASESVSLYGLPILTDRVVSYARHNPVHARELFIQEALVNCKMDSSARFYLHNKSLIDEIRLLEIKTRCFDKLDENAIYEFYNKRLPEKICSLDALNSWRKIIEKDKPDYLFITDSEILQSNYKEQPIEHYPDVITVGNTKLQASYDYNPGHEKDGVSISIPLGLIEYLAELDFENRFPAFAHEKIIFMLKKLPKSLRVKFQPMTDFANEIFEHASSSGLPLVQSLRELLLNKYGQPLPDSVVDQSAFPQHLKLNYQIIDKTGRSVFEGHDLRSIQQELLSVDIPVATVPENSKRDKVNITQWDFGDLAVAEEHEIEGSKILLYTALVDCHDSVSIELFSSKKIAERQMLNGLKRLYFLYLKSEIKYIKKNLGNELSFIKYSRNISSLEVILEQLCLKIITELFIEGFGVVRKKADFETILANNKQSFVSRFHELYKLIFSIFEKHYQVLLGLEELYLPQRKISLDDIRDQLFTLVYDGFITDIHIDNLNEYPRYLDSILLRLKKLETALKKDKAKTLMIQKYIEYCHKSGCLFVSEQELRPELIEFRWMIEEYRVSLFTQEIKTRKKVSGKKLDLHIENYKLFPMT